MQNFYIIANTEKKDTYGCAHRIKEYLLEKGKRVLDLWRFRLHQ